MQKNDTPQLPSKRIGEIMRKNAAGSNAVDAMDFIIAIMDYLDEEARKESSAE